jgi:hypothetical protein
MIREMALGRLAGRVPAAYVQGAVNSLSGEDAREKSAGTSPAMTNSDL